MQPKVRCAASPTLADCIVYPPAARRIKRRRAGGTCAVAVAHMGSEGRRSRGLGDRASEGAEWVRNAPESRARAQRAIGSRCPPRSSPLRPVLRRLGPGIGGRPPALDWMPLKAMAGVTTSASLTCSRIFACPRRRCRSRPNETSSRVLQGLAIWAPAAWCRERGGLALAALAGPRGSALPGAWRAHSAPTESPLRGGGDTVGADGRGLAILAAPANPAHLRDDQDGMGHVGRA